MSKRRVVVTGMGMLSPLAASVEGTWQRMLKGESGIAPIQGFDASTYTTRFAGEVTDFELEPYLTSKDARKMDTFIQYGIVAGHQAIDDSGLDLERVDMTRCGVAVGSGIGGLGMIEKNHIELLEKGVRRVSPFFVPGSIINMISGNLAIRLGFKGPNIAITTACTTGTHNIGYAARTIAYGDADVMLAGGAEQACTPLGISGFNACKALSTRNEDPQAASRPWDTGRDGFVLGDGAGVMVLEEYEHAKARGANILAELVGFGMSDDAYHMTLPPEQGEGAEAAMQGALRDAGVNGNQVDYVNAHGTSTPGGDVAEARGITRMLDGKDAAVSSTKSMIGHLLGAAGAVEAIFSVLAIRDQVAPPTINLQDPEPEVSLNLVPNTPQEHNIEFAISNSFGFGGTNGSLLFKRI
jgi:3-oxoacyl-[acyl-carrier-protein] synthase II